MVIGLLAVVLTIFIMPGVNLPRTTLEAQRIADQVLWTLAIVIPEFPVNFTVLPQLLGAPLFDAISRLPHPAPAAPMVLIC